MRALSIHQPWAWMIVNGWKTIENRDWPTKFRGRFLVHASKTMTHADFDDAMDLLDEALPLPRRETLERRARFLNSEKYLGGIVGEAEIIDCVSLSESRWFFGKFGFLIAGARPLPFSPCRGMLGFFDPEQGR